MDHQSFVAVFSVFFCFFFIYIVLGVCRNKKNQSKQNKYIPRTQHTQHKHTQKGTKAPQAAGVIHTDFEKGFICAEQFTYDDFKELGNEHEVKAKGKYMQRGRDYTVEDGDILFFKFGKAGK